MFVDVSTVRGPNGKTYRRALLRTSYREDGRVMHRTVGNLSSCSPEEIDAIRAALRYKDQLGPLLTQLQAPGSRGLPPNTQGSSVGAIGVLAALAKELGITAVLGEDRNGRLALWQVIARAIDQGSRLSAVRLARDLGAAAVLDLPGFDEDDLYDNLAWLDREQSRIETELFAKRYPAHQRPSLYLYDVTSTYLEGLHNALAAFGYNRDGKRGKMQIVVGLLCDEHGIPLAIEAFPGNTVDTKTFAAQIEKLRQRFDGSCVTLVGDRGMIRGPQIKELSEAGMHYITAITKAQIRSLLVDGTLQMELFEQDLAEVISTGNAEDEKGSRRYIVRRNPVRQREMAGTRQEKETELEGQIAQANAYLAAHARAKESTALRRLQKRLDKLKLQGWASLRMEGRQICLQVDEAALAEEAKLDGCYVLRTDLSPELASKEVVHDRYKSLALVEQAFRRSKTVELEMRPVHVRKEPSTRGHLLVVMLAYLLTEELGRGCRTKKLVER
jgi:transposase